jgi:prolyl-tRNA editing enzyme YbaK/EbsC (Cys-tRNA(Pro) deacylase)
MIPGSSQAPVERVQAALDALKLGIQVQRFEVPTATADPATVLAATGYPVGGVSPLGHSEPLPTLIDESLARFETVYAAAGSDDTIFPIAYQTLVEVTQGQVRELVL